MQLVQSCTSSEGSHDDDRMEQRAAEYDDAQTAAKLLLSMLLKQCKDGSFDVRATEHRLSLLLFLFLLLCECCL